MSTTSAGQKWLRVGVRLRALLAGRVLSALLVLIAVSLITFMLMQLAPGDPVDAILGEEASPESRAALAVQLGLDRPLPLRYLDWVGGVMRGDFGRSFRSGEAVIDAMRARLPVTLLLLAGAQALALLVAVPLAIAAGYAADGWLDRSSRALAITLLSTPQFLVGILLIYVFSLKLGWLPATGYTAPGESLVGSARSLMLPVVTLALVEFPMYMRLLRSELIQTLKKNYILTARALGLAPWRVLLQHALRPSSTSLVTALGINIGRMLGGAVIVEVLFGLPGLGSMLAEAIYQREYLEVQGIVLFVAIMFVLLNLVVDQAYRWLDPRVRFRERGQ